MWEILKLNELLIEWLKNSEKISKETQRIISNTKKQVEDTIDWKFEAMIKRWKIEKQLKSKRWFNILNEQFWDWLNHKWVWVAAHANDYNASLAA